MRGTRKASRSSQARGPQHDGEKSRAAPVRLDKSSDLRGDALKRVENRVNYDESMVLIPFEDPFRSADQEAYRTGQQTTQPSRCNRHLQSSYYHVGLVSASMASVFSCSNVLTLVFLQVKDVAICFHCWLEIPQLMARYAGSS